MFDKIKNDNKYFISWNWTDKHMRFGFGNGEFTLVNNKKMTIKTIRNIEKIIKEKNEVDHVTILSYQKLEDR